METKKLGEFLSGNNRESIPDVAFKVMTAIMKLTDILFRHSQKNFQTLGLKPGQTVIDYGCGPARYIELASRAVGEKGKVIAVDIHPLAIAKVKEKIKKFTLANVQAVLAEKNRTPISSEIADVVYALDMFHMVADPGEFLKELSRLVKKDGTIIIEDGHQPRTKTVHKIEQSGWVKIIRETKSHVKCQRS
ncbi:class I SAM-dependent methyltransferase [uncultured Desulfobacter sp.]|uniref:class I SAM-dependent methyltransferase n=1 Tax=uncultured Desulfobacter sp. TaxID=240139 RepID=UPI002AAB6052|nr:class I SAM-dependent methyltransferase [uncultured Desulfobacter sp.]